MHGGGDYCSLRGNSKPVRSRNEKIGLVRRQIFDRRFSKELLKPKKMEFQHASRCDNSIYSSFGMWRNLHDRKATSKRKNKWKNR